MDDYLTKPVDAGELEQAVRTWTAAQPAPATPATEPASEPASELASEPATTLPAEVIDHERVQVLEGLVKDGTTFFERTARSFMSRVDGQLSAIDEAIAAASANGLLTSAHQLKGSALNLGLPRVAQAAAALEALGIAGTTEGSAPLREVLTGEVETAVVALEQATGHRA
jgi:HPt (histidine-containing phosphotransfer) domain-containing protein